MVLNVNNLILINMFWFANICILKAQGSFENCFNYLSLLYKTIFKVRDQILFLYKFIVTVNIHCTCMLYLIGGVGCIGGKRIGWLGKGGGGLKTNLTWGEVEKGVTSVTHYRPK